MRNKVIISTLCGLFLLTSGISYATDADTILVTAGKATLTQSEFNDIVATQPPQLKAMIEAQPEIKTRMLNQWADLAILAQEAEAKGFGDKETAQRKIKEIRDRIIIQELVASKLTEITVSEEEAKTYYNSHKEAYPIAEQVKVQHILLHIKDFENTKAVTAANEKIKEIKAKLAAGESFAILAGQYSDDTDSKVKGGDVGFFPRGAMVTPFEEFSFNGAIGDISDAIKSQYGLHIIKITDKIKAGFSPFEKEAENIKVQLLEKKNQTRVETLLVDLKKKYAIKIH